MEGEECIRCEQDREYETSRTSDGGSPSYTVTRKTQFLSLLIRINEVKARSPPFSFGELSVNLIISQGPRKEQSTYHDQGFVEQGTSSFPDSRPDRLCTQFIDPA